MSMEIEPVGRVTPSVSERILDSRTSNEERKRLVRKARELGARVHESSSMSDLARRSREYDQLVIGYALN